MAADLGLSFGIVVDALVYWITRSRQVQNSSNLCYPLGPVVGLKNAMLLNLSAKLRMCYWRAEDRARHVRREQSWLRLPHRYEFQQCLALVVNGMRKRKTAEDRGIERIHVDGPAAATAWLDLPCTRQPGVNPQCRQNKLVAIVDDDGYARAGLCALIESLGYGAATFASAEDYLKSGTRENTACLILDVHLPGISGPDLQAHLIAAGHCPPTVFATGRFEEHVRKRVIEAGAVGYLAKPCSEKVLLDCIGRVFAKAA